MAKKLKVLVALEKDLSLYLGIHEEQLTIFCNSSSGDMIASSGLHRHPHAYEQYTQYTEAHTHMSNKQNIEIYAVLC